MHIFYLWMEKTGSYFPVTILYLFIKRTFKIETNKLKRGVCTVHDSTSSLKSLCSVVWWQLTGKLTVFIPGRRPNQRLIMLKNWKTLRQEEQEICRRNHLLFQQYHVFLKTAHMIWYTTYLNNKIDKKLSLIKCFSHKTILPKHTLQVTVVMNLIVIYNQIREPNFY